MTRVRYRDGVRLVARHNQIFFGENDVLGERIHYHVAVSGGLQLTPSSPAHAVFAEGYQGMPVDGMLLDDGKSSWGG